MILFEQLPDKIRDGLRCVERNGEICWEWAYGHDTDGYGLVWWDKKTWRICRLLASMFIGNISEKMVRRTCDNPPCCNPNHLILGSAQDNSNDTILRGRTLKRESNPAAKITQKIADEMRLHYQSGFYTQREIAEMYNVSRFVSGTVLKNQRWTKNGSEPILDHRENCLRNIFTPEQEAQIKEDRRINKTTYDSLAKKYKCCRQTISNIINGYRKNDT